MKAATTLFALLLSWQIGTAGELALVEFNTDSYDLTLSSLKDLERKGVTTRP